MTTWFAIRQRQWCVARLACFPSSLCLLASLLSSEALPAQAQAPQQPGAGSAPGSQSSKGGDDLFELPPVKPTRNEISVSADYLFGQGTVTFPELFSLQNSGFALGSSPDVGIADRESDYIGATISYPFCQAGSLNLSYTSSRSSALRPSLYANA